MGLEVGDAVVVWMTGVIGDFVATVTQVDERGVPIRVRLGDGSILKQGDFIVREAYPYPVDEV